MSTSFPPIRVRFANVDEFLVAYLAHPALDGIYAPYGATPPVGSVFELTIEFTPEKFLKTHAVVTAVHPQMGLALQFKNLHPAYRKWLVDHTAAYTARAMQVQQSQHQLRKATAGAQLDAAKEDLAGAAPPAQLILGIDLGTCNSAACVVIDGKPVMIDLRDAADTRTNVRSIPSAVGINAKGEELLGQPALDALPLNPRGTIFGAKRFIGRVYQSVEVQNMLARFPYKIVPGPNGRVAVDINGRPLALTAISARILSAIRTRAEAQLGVSLSHAIITVPAYYNNNQRDAVVSAAKLANLQVVRILNEPTSAAIAYGLHRTQPRKLVVYDLGGGTFDVSVMQVNHGSLQVLATAGDTFLGGEDFDNVIVKHVVEAFTGKTRKTLSQNSTAMVQIKAAVEQAKRRLSTHEKTTVIAKSVLLTDGTQTKLEIELTRERVEKLCEGLVGRSIKITEMAIKEAGLTLKDIGDVILVGGQSRMPYVQRRVRELFKMAPRVDINPDEAVALGAGLIGGLREVTLKDVLSMSIGIGVAGRMKVMIPRNAEVPCKHGVNLSVTQQEFKTYAVDVWQGDNEELHKNEHLGTFHLDCVDPGTQPTIPIRVDFILTPDCLLRVRVTHRTTEQSEQVIFSTRDSGRQPSPA